MTFANILKIAKLELKKNRSRVEKRVIIVMLILGILIYSSVTIFMRLGIVGTEKYYTFFTQDGTVREILLSTGKFIESSSADTDVLVDVTDENIYLFTKNTERAKAAITIVERAIKQFNALVYENYDSRLAYPLRIKTVQLEREENELQKMIEESIAIERDNAEANRELEEPFPERPELPEQNTQNQDLVEEQERIEEEALENLQEDSPQVLNTTTSMNLEYQYTEDVNPFSQFGVLFIVVVMTMPLSMLALIYSNSIMAEKINKRGIFLLMSPITKFEIIAGKTLPYFAASFLGFIPIIAKNVVTVLDGFYAAIILAAIILTYLAIGFIVAMFSRSHKELSFLGIFFISLYSCYLLIPAFMLNFSVISLASPLTIVAKLFQNEMVSLDLLAFSTLPTLVSAVIIFIFGSLLINDQNMFSYRTIKAKIVDAMTQILRRSKYYLISISFFSIPFIFLIQLMMIVFLLSIRSWASIYILMFFGAMIEEIFKNIGIYTIITRKLAPTKTKHLIFYSLLTGFGFFLGEKVLLLIMIAPFMEAYLTLILAGVFLPLFLHSALSFVFALAAKYFGKRNFGAAVLIATVFHFLVNFVISFLARGGI
jgi:ABC-type Na+ efflux pump permease subunit